MISATEKKRLLKLARDSIETYFSNKNPELKGTEKFNKKQGVFVTLHKDGELRGCVGFPEPVYPLNKAIVDAARAAAFEDGRFLPVADEELKDIIIEISVLTVPEVIKVKNADEYKTKIKIGRDGLIIRNPFGSGLLLPQVPLEWNWNIDDYLKHLSVKAGLPSDSWKSQDSKLYSFQAEIFSEQE